ncbi:hypothetical protein ACFQO4_16425 [Saliphagus sp. GCM10025334]
MQSLALGGVTAVAGCLTSDSRDGDRDANDERSNSTVDTDGVDDDGSETDDQSNNDDEPEETFEARDEPLFRQWTPAMDTYDYDETPGFLELDVQAAYDLADTASSVDRAELEKAVEVYSALGISSEELDRYLNLHVGEILYGSFDPSVVTDAIETAGYADASSHGAYEVYDGVSVQDGNKILLEDSAVAVGPSTLVVAPTAGLIDENAANSSTLSVGSLLETGGASGATLPETHDDVGTLLEVLEEAIVPSGESSYLFCFASDSTGRPSYEPGGFVVSWSFGAGRTELSTAWIYEDLETLHEERVRSHIESWLPLEYYNETSVWATDRVAVYEGWIETTAFNYFEPPADVTRHTGPQAGLSLDEEDGKAVITITVIEHLDGLWIERNGETVRVDDDPSVGVTYTISVEAEDRIVVIGLYEGTESILLEHVANGY